MVVWITKECRLFSGQVCAIPAMRECAVVQSRAPHLCTNPRCLEKRGLSWGGGSEPGEGDQSLEFCSQFLHVNVMSFFPCPPCKDTQAFTWTLFCPAGLGRWKETGHILNCHQTGVFFSISTILWTGLSRDGHRLLPRLRDRHPSSRSEYNFLVNKICIEKQWAEK